MLVWGLASGACLLGDLVVGPALFRVGPVEGQAVEREVRAIEPEGEEVCEVPFDARRSVCPISGERFERCPGAVGAVCAGLES